jgi:hypothetical protein
MGKIFIHFRKTIAQIFPSLHMDGIDFKDIKQIIDSLPGQTTITEINELPQQANTATRIWKLNGENSVFYDGTEIVGKYKSVAVLYPGQPTYATLVFDGVDVLQPSNGQPGIPATNGPSGVAGQSIQIPTPFVFQNLVSPVSNPIIPPTITSSNNPYANIQDDDDIFDLPTCDCGAAAVGGGHSGWCSIQQAINTIYGDHNG